MAVFHANSSYHNTILFFTLWVGRQISTCFVKRSCWRGGNKNRKKSATETGVILGMLLDIIMMKMNVLDQRKWTLVMPGAVFRDLSGWANFGLAWH